MKPAPICLKCRKAFCLYRHHHISLAVPEHGGSVLWEVLRLRCLSSLLVPVCPEAVGLFIYSHTAGSRVQLPVICWPLSFGWMDVYLRLGFEQRRSRMCVPGLSEALLCCWRSLLHPMTRLCLTRIEFLPTRDWKNTEDESLLVRDGLTSSRRKLLCRDVSVRFMGSGDSFRVQVSSTNLKNGIFNRDVSKPRGRHSCEDMAVNFSRAFQPVSLQFQLNTHTANIVLQQYVFIKQLHPRMLVKVAVSHVQT